MRFEGVVTFKYLGVRLDITSGRYDEVEKKTRSERGKVGIANRSFGMLRSFFKSKILSIKLKITMCKVFVRPIRNR